MSNSEEQVTSYTVLLGRFIARIRKQNGFDQIQFAKKANMSQPTLSKIENGQIILNVVQLKNISEALGVDSSFILENVERIAQNVRRKGIAVINHKPDQSVNIFLGAAAITGIIAFLLSE